MLTKNNFSCYDRINLEQIRAPEDTILRGVNMKNLITMELKRDLEYCQKKIKLELAQLAIIENDDSFNESDVRMSLINMESLFKCRLEKMEELEQELEK